VSRVTHPSYPRIASLKTAAAFRDHLSRSSIAIDFDETLAPASASPLAQPVDVAGTRVGNRFCILPMEGWDGTREGEPSDLTTRRWRRFGISGAKLMWGCEAVAVRHDGRANPHQLMLTPRTQPAIAALRTALVDAHRERFGAQADADLLVGLQLTHSGRFARPDVYDRPAPLTASVVPVLDRRFKDGVRLLDDDELQRLVGEFVEAARLARDAGFAFVDVKHCHGYLGHELLGSRSRPGKYGGSLENRTRFMREIVEGIKAEAPGLMVGVRLSAFDTVPYRPGAGGVGEPDPGDAAGFGFGVLDGEDMEAALEEAKGVLRMLSGLGVNAVCVTGGTPYYNPHVQRPAMFPPVDGYDPPEDPLRGVARQIDATARLKRAFPEVTFVGSAYSYLQEWLPNVAQHAVREGLTDLVGLGRVTLSYPELAAHVLQGKPLQRKLICRTFSDCTTGPRMGLVSGCYPLDSDYAATPEAPRILAVRTGRATEGAKHT
jgi:2,4-dienoyl-CoA reductase-like NADH-dependent reductase (Old Yellow Enzyme family)